MAALDALDLARELVRVCLLAAAPLLMVALVAGLLAGLLQAATQVHEHTLSFVPRLLAVAAAAAAILPWLIASVAEYTRQLISTIPERL
jgi:flagellar biosynthetic protein FliQ